MQATHNKNYLCHPNQIRLIDEGSTIQSELPFGVYKLCFNPMVGAYLEPKPRITKPTLLFGKAQEQVDRILKAYAMRETSTGILLHGIAGSGKTLTTQAISAQMQDSGVSVIFIDGTVRVEVIAEVLTDIKTECVIVFDEFEKNFDKENQNKLLSALDGVYSSKKLILFTTNDIHKVSDFIRNRPSRALYSIGFEKMDLNTLREVMDYYEVLEGDAKDIERVHKRCNSFSFDILRNIISEINLHKCSVKDAVEWLNIGVSTKDYYRLKLKVNSALTDEAKQELSTSHTSEGKQYRKIRELENYAFSGDVEDIMSQLLDSSNYPSKYLYSFADYKPNPKEIENWLYDDAHGAFLLWTSKDGLTNIQLEAQYSYNSSVSFF